MNIFKNKFLLITIIVLCISIVAAFFVSNNNSKYLILKYQLNNSTENLIDVCDILIVEGNDHSLKYINELLTRDDFEEVYSKEQTEVSWERYNDLLILQAFKCMVKSNIAFSEQNINYYFRLVKMSEPLAHLSYALAEDFEFANENKDVILNSIIKLYNDSTGSEKQKYLEYIVAFYDYFDIKNKTSQMYESLWLDSVSNMTEYEYKFSLSDIEFAKYCWSCMFTGEYNSQIIDYYNFMFKKIRQGTDD